MMSLLVSILVMAVAVYLTAVLVPGFEIEGFPSALGVAAVYGVLNALLYKLVFVLTFPLALLTLGLVVNMILLWLTSKIVSNVKISGIISCFFAALLIALIRHGLHLVVS